MPRDSTSLCAFSSSQYCECLKPTELPAPGDGAGKATIKTQPPGGT
jgi:hypothetical protein